MTPVLQLLALALQHYRKDEWPQAEQLYRRVLQVDPNQAEALRILALIACQTGRGHEAVDNLRAVLRSRPRWADAHNDLGMVFISQMRLPEAAASFREAVRLQPDLAAAHNNLGNALRELGRPAEAAASLREAVRLVPGYAEAHYNLALALAADSRSDEALASFEQSVRLKPEYAEAKMRIGSLEKPVDIKARFQENLRPQATNVKDRTQPEVTPSGDDQLGASNDNCHKSPALDKDDARNKVLAKADDSAGAIGRNERVSHRPSGLAQVPDDVVPDVPSANRLDNTQTSWEQTLHLGSDYARLHYYLASVLEKQGRVESALAHYEEVMRLEPNHRETLVRIDTLRRARGSVDDAPDASSQAILSRSAGKDIPMTVTSNHRHKAPRVQQEYERWDRDHSERSAECARPVAARVRDSAALDVYFGLVGSAPASADDGCGAETALEAMGEQAERAGEVPADACAP
jgi:tetratricopeptide (TPR) repeat protein